MREKVYRLSIKPPVCLPLHLSLKHTPSQRAIPYYLPHSGAGKTDGRKKSKKYVDLEVVALNQGMLTTITTLSLNFVVSQSIFYISMFNLD